MYNWSKVFMKFFPRIIFISTSQWIYHMTTIRLYDYSCSHSYKQELENGLVNGSVSLNWSILLLYPYDSSYSHSSKPKLQMGQWMSLYQLDNFRQRFCARVRFCYLVALKFACFSCVTLFPLSSKMWRTHMINFVLGLILPWL